MTSRHIWLFNVVLNSVAFGANLSAGFQTENSRHFIGAAISLGVAYLCFVQHEKRLDADVNDWLKRYLESRDAGTRG